MRRLRRMTKKAPLSPTRQFWVLYSWIFLYLISFESLTRWMTSSSETSLFSFGLFSAVLFSLSLSFLILSFIYLFHEKYHFILAFIWLFILFVLFTSQLIYYDIFRTFYFFQSLGHISQGLSFQGVIFSTLSKNVWWIILSLLIIGLYLFIEIRKRKKYVSNRFNWKTKSIFIVTFLIFAIFFHFVAIWSVKGNDRAASVYFNAHVTNYSVEMLGLFTTFRLDVQRSLTKWSPSLEDPIIVEEEPEEDEPNNKEDPSNEKEQIPDDDIPPKIVEFNELNIDFDKLIEQTDSEDIAQLHRYFKQKQPTNKNEFTGKYEGYNLIWITAEAFAPYAIRKDLTPTLYKMATEGYQFTNFYNPIWGVSTSDGEYTILHSLVPKAGVWSFSKSSHNDLPFAIGNQLKQLGYETLAYHNHNYNYYDRDKSFPNIGYTYKGIGSGLDISAMWPRSDLEMIEKTVDEYIDHELFHVYYMTISGHLEYNFIGNNIAMKNKQYVEHLPLSEEAKAYLAGQIELDKALETLLYRLEEAGVLNKTLFVLTNDHYPYGLENETIEELTGETVDEKFGLYKSSWLLYATDMKEEKVVIDDPTSPLDMLPTISNLMGLAYDSRLFMGRDVFSDEEPLIVFNDKSFISKEMTYYYPLDEVTSLIGEPINEELLKKYKQKTDEIFYLSSKILDLNYYSFLQFEK